MAPLAGLRAFSASELQRFDGISDRQILVGFKGLVYDVSARRDLYCKADGGTYAALAGRDATRALAKMSLKAEDIGRCDVDDLLASEHGELHEKAIRDWQTRFQDMYAVVGSMDGLSVPQLPAPAAAPALHPAAQAAGLPPPLRAPGKPELLCRKPRIYRVRGFLAQQECKLLRQMSTGPQALMFAEAKIRDGLRVSDDRWSQVERDLLQGIETRLGWLLGVPPHRDEIELVGTLTPPCPDGPERCHLGLHVDTNGGRHWRYATAICYLSTVRDGGRTCFPLARTAEEEDCGPPGDEELELLEASERLLDDGVDHTDRVLVGGQWPERRRDAEALVAAGGACRGVSVLAEEGSVVLFWTRRCDGSIDPFSWHGGEAVGLGESKWTLQKFKEVPLDARASPAALAEFVARTRRNLMP